MNRAWIAALADVSQRNEAAVLITVLSDKGSTPRDAGAKMLVTAQQQFDTVGGGHLEFKAIALAREMIAQRAEQPHTERYSLGATLGQCCGGATQLLFEPLHCAQPTVVVFGAGHVAKALLPLLAQLPLTLRWVDQRAQQFDAVVPSGVEQLVCETPEQVVEEQLAGTYYLVMTHNHQLDLRLSKAILSRGDAAYFGLIGSHTKRIKFEHRLRARGFTQLQLEQMICPVGLDNSGKLPIEIAVSIAAQLIAHYNSARAAQSAPETEQHLAS
ncbi:MAG: xanthine dehydrogenase accessory protein XdhC [Pseudomonadales bacterium]